MIARRFDAVLARSEYDEQYLRALLPGGTSFVLPHPAGLDPGLAQAVFAAIPRSARRAASVPTLRRALAECLRRETA